MAFLIAQAACCADAGEPATVPGHPRLLFTAQELPTLRAKAKDAAVDELGLSGALLWKNVLSAAEAALGKPVAPKFEEYAARATGRRWAPLALAYAVTEEDKYLEQLRADLRTVLAWATWGPVGQFSPYALPIGVAVTLDVAWDKLPDEERRAACAVLAKKGLLPLYEAGRGKKFAEPNSNGRVFYYAALGLGAMVLLGEKDYPDAERWADEACESMKTIFDRSDPDGSWAEGIGYGSRLATSPGYHHGRAWRATYGHNLLWVDGKGQNNSMIGEKGGNIVEFVGAPFFDYVVGEAHPYGTPKDPLIESWRRHVVFAKPDYLVILDDIKPAKDVPREYKWILNATCAHAVGQKGEFKVEADTFLAFPQLDPSGQLFGKVILPADISAEAAFWDEKEFKETYGPYYALTPKEKRVRERFLIVLYPQPRGAQAPAIKGFDAQGGHGIEVAVPGGRNLHLYRARGDRVAAQGLDTDGLTCMVGLTADGGCISYALVDGTERVAIVTADIISFPDRVVSETRQRIEKLTGIDRNRDPGELMRSVREEQGR